MIQFQHLDWFEGSKVYCEQSKGDQESCRGGGKAREQRSTNVEVHFRSSSDWDVRYGHFSVLNALDWLSLSLVSSESKHGQKHDHHVWITGAQHYCGKIPALPSFNLWRLSTGSLAHSALKSRKSLTLGQVLKWWQFSDTVEN